MKDRIPPFPTPEALKFFESQFGLPASKVFAEISEKPIAAASLGQVYRGTWIEITSSPSVNRMQVRNRSNCVYITSFGFLFEADYRVFVLLFVGTARLHSGEAVAVKVQRPGVPEVLALDAHLLRILGGQMQRFAGARGDLVAVVDEMVTCLTFFSEISISETPQFI